MGTEAQVNRMRDVAAVYGSYKDAALPAAD